MFICKNIRGKRNHKSFDKNYHDKNKNKKTNSTIAKLINLLPSLRSAISFIHLYLSRISPLPIPPLPPLFLECDLGEKRGRRSTQYDMYIREVACWRAQGNKLWIRQALHFIKLWFVKWGYDNSTYFRELWKELNEMIYVK